MRFQSPILIALGVVLLSAASQISTPMAPVPMTLQSLAVLVIASAYGLRLGLTTIAAWLVIAALGAPVLADASGGLAKFYGPTAGYIAGFIVAGALVGAIAALDMERAGPVRLFVAMCAGHVIMLGLGVAWLQTSIGWSAALENGFTPFLLGAAVKSALGAAIILAIRKWRSDRVSPTVGDERETSS